MKRRNFIATLGVATTSGATLLGTSAFTSVQAERSISIAVEEDYDAFLQMEPIGDEGIDGENTGRSFFNADTLAFEIPGDEDGENPDAEGVGLDSVYEFHDLATITNQGTQTVTLHSTYDGSNFADLALVDDEGVLRDDPPELGVGESHDAGLYIDTHDSSLGEFDETLTIVAERVGGNQD